LKILLQYSIGRLTGVLEEIDRLLDSEFPYTDSKIAFELVRERFQKHLDDLKDFQKTPKDERVVAQFCSVILNQLFTYLPLLGFLLRSTNVRNAFEVYGPLKRLCKQVLGRKVKLVLSSEWNFSPYTYPEFSYLPDFILIGVPATESANPLLIPLSGHELGHTFWRTCGLQKAFPPKVEDSVFKILESRHADYVKIYPNQFVQKGTFRSNIFVQQTVALSIAWANRQIEEYFCDLVGYYLFDEAYIYAFSYLLSPTPGATRNPLYPSFKSRIDAIAVAATEFRKQNPEVYNFPAGVTKLFEDGTPPLGNDRDRFLVSLSDQCASELLPELIAEVQRRLTATNTPVLIPKNRDEVLERFNLLVPSVKAETLTDVLNAGWKAALTENFWSNSPQVEHPDRALKALLLKNIEVLEINWRKKEGKATL
jgi:hypothetical protein